jgi:hypothetical protein
LEWNKLDGVERNPFPLVTDSPFDFEMYQDGGGYSGGIEFAPYTTQPLGPDDYPTTLFVSAEFDKDEVQVDVRSDAYDYVKWGRWMDPDMRYFSKNDDPQPGNFAYSIGGQLTLLDSIPKSGKATYYGDMGGELVQLHVWAIRDAWARFKADFSDNSIAVRAEGFYHTPDGINIPMGWSGDLGIGQDGLVSGVITDAANQYTAETDAAFVGPNAEEIMGVWSFENSEAVGTGFIAGKR